MVGGRVQFQLQTFAPSFFRSHALASVNIALVEVGKARGLRAC